MVSVAYRTAGAARHCTGLPGRDRRHYPGEDLISNAVAEIATKRLPRYNLNVVKSE